MPLFRDFLNRINFFHISKRFKQRKFDQIKSSHELKYRLLDECYIVVQVDGVGFKNFTRKHLFHKPVDQRNINLMNECATSLFDEFRPHMLCAYGFSDEMNFAFEKNIQMYERNYK